MNLDKFLVIAGVPGVHKLVSTRSNGLVIEDRKEKRTRFVPVRQNQITPLGTVAVYVDTDEGTLPLADVFQRMIDHLESHPPVSIEENSAALRAYFLEIVPEHDQDRVHINDIKKCLKWFGFMMDNGIFDEIKRDSEDKSDAPVEEETPDANAPEKAETT